MNWIIAKSKRCSPLWMGTGGFILQEGDWVRGVDEEGNGAGAGQRALDSLECDKQKPVAKWKTRWQPLVFFLLCSCTSLLIVPSLSPQHSFCLFRCLCFYVACFWARREIIIHTCDQPGGVGHWVLDPGRWVLVHSPVGGWVVDSKKMQLPKSSRQKESENEEQVDVVERLRCLFALIANGIFSRGSEGALKRGRRMWMWMWKWRTCTLQADQPHHHHPYLLHQHRQHREAGS